MTMLVVFSLAISEAAVLHMPKQMKDRLAVHEQNIESSDVSSSKVAHNQARFAQQFELDSQQLTIKVIPGGDLSDEKLERRLVNRNVRSLKVVEEAPPPESSEESSVETSSEESSTETTEVSSTEESSSESSEETSTETTEESSTETTEESSTESSEETSTPEPETTEV